MIRYIIKRILLLIPTVLCVAILIFTIMYFCPGDPARNILGSGATEAEVEEQRELMGLNDPYIVQLKDFMVDMFIHFDPGRSWMSGLSVTYELRSRIPITLTLAILTMLFSIVVGIPLGVTAAVHQNHLSDRICMISTMVLISVPNFWLAIEMVILFTLTLGWLPAFGIGGIKFWIMPVIANSLSQVATNARQTRSAMLEVIRSDYITTARAKGVPEMQVRYRYALPNALIPLITLLGGNLAGCLGGSMVIENVFSIPGMGMYLTQAINNRDYPVVRSVVVILSIFFGVVIMLVDVAYAYVDPRIKSQYTGNTSGRKKRRASREKE